MEPKSERQPPSDPPAVAVGFAGDEIEELAAQIVALKPTEADSLVRYLEATAVKSLGIPARLIDGDCNYSSARMDCEQFRRRTVQE